MKQYMVEGHLHPKGNSWCGKTEPSDIIKLYKEWGYTGDYSFIFFE